jgi:hypothetical protein
MTNRNMPQCVYSCKDIFLNRDMRVRDGQDGENDNVVQRYLGDDPGEPILQRRGAELQKSLERHS